MPSFVSHCLKDSLRTVLILQTVTDNAGIGYGATSSKEITSDGISAVFAVNTLAPYILTCLMDKPKSRILFMSSDSHFGGDESLKDCTTSTSYANSKLHDTMLSKAFARRWTDVQSVSMHPGWLKTKMGGSSAPGTTDKSSKVLAEWSAGEGFAAKLSSGAFFTTGGEQLIHRRIDQRVDRATVCGQRIADGALRAGPMTTAGT